MLVTGASKGVGKAIAIAVAQAGASGLILFARSDLSTTREACLSAQRAGKSLNILTFAVDIVNYQQVVAAVKKAEETFGRLDVVINNAAQLNEHMVITDGDVGDWWGIWDTNLRGAYHVTRATLPLLIKSNGDKTIINVSSLAAAIVLPAMSSYSVSAESPSHDLIAKFVRMQISKLAVLRFSEFINSEYGDKGVVSYSVHPGAIPTDMSAIIPDEMKHILVDTLELAAHTLVWLIKKRREWLAGRFISCTWDVEEFESLKDEIVQGDKLKVRVTV